MRYAILAVLVLGLVGCEGPMGPEGPRGPEGPQGPIGPAGVSGGARMATFAGQVEAEDGIEIHLSSLGTFSDPPAVTVYVSAPSPASYEDEPSTWMAPGEGDYAWESWTLEDTGDGLFLRIPVPQYWFYWVVVVY